MHVNGKIEKQPEIAALFHDRTIYFHPNKVQSVERRLICCIGFRCYCKLAVFYHVSMKNGRKRLK